MGSFIHYCEHCNAKLNVDNAWLGKSMKCPACSKKITFPAADGSEVQSVPTINLRDLPNRKTSTESTEFPSAPDFAMPEAPEKPALPKSPPTSGTSPRRIQLKPLKGVNETVPSQPNISLPTGSGEMPFPPLMEQSEPSDPSIPLPPSVMPPPAKDETVFESFSTLPGAGKIFGKDAEKNDIAKTETEFETLNKATETTFSNTMPEMHYDEPANPVKLFFGKNYFWGRLGSASVYVLAGIAVLCGFYFSYQN